MRNNLIRILCCLLLVAAVTPAVIPSEAADAPQWTKPAERYKLAYSNGTQTFQMDTHSLQKINDPYRDEQLVEAWIRVITPDGTAYGKISMQQYYFRLNQKQIQLMSSFDIGPDGQQAGSGSKFTYRADRWQDVVPGTVAEGLYNAVTEYAAVKFPPPKEKGKFLGLF